MNINDTTISFFAVDLCLTPWFKTIEYGDERLKEAAGASYSVLRAKFDPWLAERAEEAGAMYVTGIRVDKLLQRKGRVCGVIAGEDVLCADVVLLADGL